MSVGRWFHSEAGSGPQARWSEAGPVEGNAVVAHLETLLKVETVGCLVLGVWRAKSLNWQRVLEDRRCPLELREY